MGKCAGHFYQSGERVSTTGTYEVIGVTRSAATQQQESALRHFQLGEFFPTYDGWEVCWRSCDEPGGTDFKEGSQPESDESRRSR